MMSNDPVPADVRELIARHIDSVGQLEALLFLRSRPAESWDPRSIAKRLYAPEHDVAQGLEALCREGFLVETEQGYRFLCSAELQARLDRLAETYARQLIPITNLIHAKPRNIRLFSDAFRFRKDR
jgi:hypothetical protein